MPGAAVPIQPLITVLGALARRAECTTTRALFCKSRLGAGVKDGVGGDGVGVFIGLVVFIA